MLLSDLVAELAAMGAAPQQVIGPQDVEVQGIAFDSRRVVPGDLFVAIPGHRTDGQAYIPEAIKRGAIAVVAEQSHPLPSSQLTVPSAREALARLSAVFYGHPTRSLTLVGVTGTNGKTTTCYLLEALLAAAGKRTARLGTTGVHWPGVDEPATLTTPESVHLQSWFSRMVQDGVTHAVMEVSSHALAQDRVTGCTFAGGIFTNLTHDHLDFHPDMETYFATKQRLFTMIRDQGAGSSGQGGFGVLNLDDPWGKRLGGVMNSARIITYGFSSEAQVRAADIQVTIEACRFTLIVTGEKIQISCPLVGAYNVSNVLAAVAAGLGLGLPLKGIAQAIEAFPGVPGRFERVDVGQPFSVIVDYAHSPDSLRKLLETVRSLTKGRVLLVFGCPGDRDQAKRPVMGELACDLADEVVISTDDPHTEDPRLIAEAVVDGAERSRNLKKQYRVEIDRKRAIETALSQARAGDAVVLAGRGHEGFQDMNGTRVPIDDREVARIVLLRN